MIEAPAFESFRKIPRWSRQIFITEKIDGTNASILIGPEPFVYKSGQVVPFLVGSRNRWIQPEKDNFGFARWAYEHTEDIMRLGQGQHFGEWWGPGIQRGYGLANRRFSLFNVTKYTPEKVGAMNVELKEPIFFTVPLLYSGENNEQAILATLDRLRDEGSMASPGFMRPEGIVIYHCASGGYFKKTLEADEKPKGSTE